MKNKMKRICYRVFAVVTAVICLLLICDGISRLFLGHFSLFTHLEHFITSGMMENIDQQMTLDELQAVWEKVKARSDFVDSLEGWHTPVLQFLHEVLLLLNIAYLFFHIMSLRRQENSYWWIHILFFAVLYVFYTGHWLGVGAVACATAIAGLIYSKKQSSPAREITSSLAKGALFGAIAAVIVGAGIGYAISGSLQGAGNGAQVGLCAGAASGAMVAFAMHWYRLRTII